nr:hypothetical protein CFP56_23478 [Quercus suber]
MASTKEASNNQSYSTVNEGFVNPFFLSNSDSNTVQLVSKKLVGGKNYFPWARSVIISLTTEHKSVGDTQHSTPQQSASLPAASASTSQQPLALSASTSNYLNNFSVSLPNVASSFQPVTIDNPVTDVVPNHSSADIEPLDCIPSSTDLDSQVPNIPSV